MCRIVQFALKRCVSEVPAVSAILKWLKNKLPCYSIIGYTRLLLVIAVVAPTIFFFIFVKHEFDLTRGLILKSFEQTVDLQKTMIDNWFAEHQNQINTFAQLQSTRGGNQAAIKQNIEVFLKNNQEFYWVSFIDIAGRAFNGSDVSDREYFKQGLLGRPYVTDVVYSRTTQRPVVVFSSPVFDQAGMVTGIIAGSVELKTITAMMEHFQFGETGETYLADRSGMMVTATRLADDAASRGVEIINDRASVKGVHSFEQAIQGRRGSGIYTDFRGQRVIGAYSAIHLPRWAIIADVDEAEILTPVYQKIQLLGSGYLGVLIILIFSITMFSRKVNRPVIDLVNRAVAIENGHYGVGSRQEDIFASAPLELQKLNHSFVAMAEKLIKTIDDLQQSKSIMTETEAKYRNLVERSPVGIYYVINGQIAYLNPKMEEMIGYTLEEVRKLPDFFEYVHPDDRGLVMEKMQRRLVDENEGIEYDLRILRKDGSSLEAHVLAGTCMINGEKAVFGSVVDISERKQWESTLEYISYHDTTTGLYNRSYFEFELARASISGKSVGIIMCDVDGLKLINDSLGHQAGDMLLKAAAQTLLFEDPTIVAARIGGDEFAVLVPDAEEERTVAVVEEIRTRIAQYCSKEGSLPLHVSIGYCQGIGFIVYDVFRRADDAMYQDKKANYEQARESIARYLHIANKLR